MSVNVRELQEEVEVGTSIIQDNIDVELQMGEARVFGPVFWDLVEAEVEVTQIASPNYVKGRATVKPESIARGPALRRHATFQRKRG